MSCDSKDVLLEHDMLKKDRMAIAVITRVLPEFIDEQSLDGDTFEVHVYSGSNSMSVARTSDRRVLMKATKTLFERPCTSDPMDLKGPLMYAEGVTKGSYDASRATFFLFIIAGATVAKSQPTLKALLGVGGAKNRATVAIVKLGRGDNEDEKLDDIKSKLAPEDAKACYTKYVSTEAGFRLAILKGWSIHNTQAISNEQSLATLLSRSRESRGVNTKPTRFVVVIENTQLMKDLELLDVEPVTKRAEDACPCCKRCSVM